MDVDRSMGALLILFLIIGGLTLLNMLVGIIVDIVSVTKKEEEEKGKKRKAARRKQTPQALARPCIVRGKESRTFEKSQTSSNFNK